MHYCGPVLRALLSGGVTVVIALVLTVAGATVFELLDGAPFTGALVDGALRLVFGSLWFVLPLWGAALIGASLVWRRCAGARMLILHVVVALACAVLATGVWFAVAVTEGGWALLLVAISVLVSGLLVAATTVSAAMVQLWWFRVPRSRMEAAPLPVAGTGA